MVDQDTDGRRADAPSGTDGERPASEGDETGATDRWSRPAQALLALGLLLAVASLTFPLYALDGYTVDAYEVQASSVTDENGDLEADVVAFEDLSAREQSIVEAAVRGTEPTMYAPYYAHQDEDGALPPLFSDNWVDDYSVGAVVEYGGSYYRVSTWGSVPFHFAFVVPGGVVLGGALAGLAWLSTRRGWRWPQIAGLLVGLVLLGLLVLLGNLDGYRWPVQY